MSDVQGRIPFSNSPKLHDRIGNIKTDKKELAKSAFRNAEELYTGAGLIFMQNIQLIQVVSVNLAFACELFLKAILYELDIDFGRTHRIVELFQLLPEEYQKKIKENVNFKYEKKVILNWCWKKLVTLLFFYDIHMREKLWLVIGMVYL